LKNYTFLEINKKEAFKIWQESSCQSVYTNPRALDCLNLKKKLISYYAAKVNDKFICYWPIYCDKKNKISIPYNFYYFGPVWSDNIKKYPIHSLINIKLSIYEGLLRKILSIHKTIHFNTHYLENDIRYFNWLVNSGLTSCNLLKSAIITPKYTAIVDNFLDYKKKWRNLRIRKLKLIEKYSGVLMVDKHITKNEFINLYYKSMKNKLKDKKNDNDFINSIDFFFNLVNKNFGYFITIKEKKSKKVLATSLILKDNKSSHLVYNIANLDWKEKGIMQMLINENFKKNVQDNIKIFDFNGANSYIGADDKHSYGSVEKLYFDIVLKG
jgi:hypothetical protein